MDPFVSLSSAAAVTNTIKLGTGVCLVIQRDTIQTAKLVASLDQVSSGRFLFGIGGGWNRDEMEDHGTVYATRFKKMREQIEAMRVDLDREQARISRRDRRFPADDDLAEAGAEAITRRSLSAACSRTRRGARSATAMAGSRIRAARNTRTSPITCRSSAKWRPRPGATSPRCRSRSGGFSPISTGSSAIEEQGVSRGVVQLAPEPADKTLPILDRWAELIRRLGAGA